MYYKSGNFEAFARPRKPKGVDEKSAYIVGSGIGSLATAAFLIRDGQMDGSRITILEAFKLPGGALDGIKHPSGGFMIRGDREQSDDMVCLWDLMRSIPSLEVENASVLDEFYWLQKDDPHRSLRRMTQNRGEPVPTDGKYTLSSQAQREMNLLSITRDEDLYDKKMNEVLGKDFFDSNFWVYWRTMFDFYEWHSALEMKRYLLRFIHHIDGQPNLTAVMYTRYNQYESFVLPLVDWLKQHGVVIQYDTRVTNVQFNINPDRKVAQRIDWIQGGRPGGLDLTENNLKQDGPGHEPPSHGDLAGDDRVARPRVANRRDDEPGTARHRWGDGRVPAVLSTTGGCPSEASRALTADRPALAGAERAAALVGADLGNGCRGGGSRLAELDRSLVGGAAPDQRGPCRRRIAMQRPRGLSAARRLLGRDLRDHQFFGAGGVRGAGWSGADSERASLFQLHNPDDDRLRRHHGRQPGRAHVVDFRSDRRDDV
jgi:MCRA family